MKSNRAKILEVSLVILFAVFVVVTFLVKPVACIGFDVMCNLWK